MNKFGVIMVVLKKELLDMFRDKKTIIFSLLLPLIMIPVLSFFIGSVMTNETKKVENNLSISLKDEGNSNFSKYLKEQKNIKIAKSSDVKSDINKGKILAEISIPKDFDQTLLSGKNAKLTLTYDNSSTNAQTAVSIINSYINQYSKSIVTQRLISKGMNPEILNPINVEENTLEKKEQGEGKMLASLLIPIFLMLYSFAGTLGPAVDLGAGEKERGTLEPLLTTKASRTMLLWGKFLSISIMGVIISLASLLSIVIAALQKNGMFGNIKNASFKFTPSSIVILILIPILTTMVFGALELSLSIYARSFKEAQTYLSPINIVAFLLIYLPMMKDAKNIELFYFNIPITNATCLLKEIFSGVFNPMHIGITFLWMAIYMVVSLIFARYMYSREEVIFRT